MKLIKPVFTMGLILYTTLQQYIFNQKKLFDINLLSTL
jgi:hypothetical protein